jgi:hypothetical protein
MNQKKPTLQRQMEFIADLRESFDNSQRERITNTYSPSEVDAILVAVYNTLLKQKRDSIKPAVNGSIHYAR